MVQKVLVEIDLIDEVANGLSDFEVTQAFVDNDLVLESVQTLPHSKLLGLLRSHRLPY